jgi:gas vesicle protein
MGLLTGTVIGAGLGMLLAPKAGTELRGQLGEQARNFGNIASEQYRRASEQAGAWAERGREFVDRTRDSVNRGWEEGRSYTGATTGSDYGSSNTGTTGPNYGGTSSTSGTGSDFGRS